MRLRHKITPLPFEEAVAKLERMGQGHLLAWWESLDRVDREHLLLEITLLDEQLIAKMHQETSAPRLSYSPYRAVETEHTREDWQRGFELISSGKCACLLLAGGSGSRLRVVGPKGCLPISVVKKKSLYQLVAEKVRAAGQVHGRPLEVAVMTSPLNHLETETFFAQHAFFGLSPGQLHFFYQQMWPLLDMQQNLFLEAPCRIALGPNGNGSALHRLYDEGIFALWREKGIEYVNLVLVDNPLAAPFDPLLFGFHSRQGCDVSIKAVERKSPQEKVGVLVEAEGKLRVVEYTELKSQEGEPPAYANMSLFCFSMDFIETLHSASLPLHRVKKAVKTLTPEGITFLPLEPNAWKYEQFIFDVLPFAEHSKALLYSRKESFAPLKNLHGEDSITTVQAALQAADREAFSRITGTAPPQGTVFELAPEFHYPTDELKGRWKGRELPHQGYIEG